MTEENEVKRVIEDIKIIEEAGKTPILTKKKEIIMQKDDNVFLRFKNNEVKAEYYFNNRKYVKNLRLEDVANILNKHIKIDTGYQYLAGKDYIGIRRFIRYGSTEIFLIESSAGKRNIIFDMNNQDNEIIEIDCPSFLMIVVADEIKIIASRIFSIKIPAVSGKVELYRFPFGNVYDDGRICWGSNNDINNKINKFRLLNLFLNSGFNQDLSFGINIPNMGSKDLNYMIRKFKEDPTFQNQYFLHQRINNIDKPTIDTLVNYFVEHYIKKA